MASTLLTDGRVLLLGTHLSMNCLNIFICHSWVVHRSAISVRWMLVLPGWPLRGTILSWARSFGFESIIAISWASRPQRAVGTIRVLTSLIRVETSQILRLNWPHTIVNTSFGPRQRLMNSWEAISPTHLLHRTVCFFQLFCPFTGSLLSCNILVGYMLAEALHLSFLYPHLSSVLHSLLKVL